MIKDYFSLALRNITKRKLRSWLTMIGIFIGIAAVVSLISLGDGMKYAITSQFSSFGTDKLTIQAGGLNAFGPPGSGAVNKLTTDNVDAINRITGVKLAISRMMRMVKLEFNEEISYESATNLPEELDKRNLVLEVLNLDLVEGRHLKPTDKYKVVIGNAIVYKNKFSKAPKLGDNILIEDKQFQIVGILEASGNPMLSSIVIINDEILREILDLDDEVDLIAAQVKNQNEMDKIAEEVNKVMRDERDVDIGEEDFTVETPAQTLQSVNTILNVVQAVLVGIAAISLFVGGIGIMNTMYTS
ncbi:ABC transporter permease, partial [Candidatus Woesearchaeota archaeon]|nr:ABC transporter permease [Candidatus Woesearchaeota archaeon]